MDKKTARGGPSQRGATDVKKLQDGTVGKSFTKHAHRRESSAQKDPPHKNATTAVHKVKHDKKPVPRKFCHNSRATSSKVVELEELGIGASKSKKRNVTHLLNFQCKPRESPSYSSHRSWRSAPNTVRGLMATHKHKYNKEQFLQATCQFVVQNGHDYSVNMADPDTLVDWSLIEQIRVSSPEGINCPICLYPPVAGKITRCGHIYCWSCILHYLSLTDKNWQKCPICYESIHQRDLKSVTVLERRQYTVGEEITFRLMKRERGSTIAIPVSELTTHPHSVLLSVSEDTPIATYSKLLLANAQDVLDVIDEEEKALKAQMGEYEHLPELCFVLQAVQLLTERKQQILFTEKLVDSSLDVKKKEADTSENGARCSEEDSFLSDNIQPLHKVVYESAFDDISKIVTNESSMDFKDKGSTPDESDISPEEDTKEKLELRTRQESTSSSGEEPSTITAADLELPCTTLSSPNKDYFFYQASDGQQIFLHSVNARMLAMTYEGLEKAPNLITGKIVEIECGSMTEDLRKRLRYLEHLPITCPFEVVEIELQPPFVTDETRAFFREQLDKRLKQRQKRAKEEKRMEKRAKELEKMQYGRRSSPRRLCLDSYHHFPECGSDTPPDISPRSRSLESSRASSPQSCISRRAPSPPLPAIEHLNLRAENTFAQKLKNSPGNAWKKREVPTVSTDEEPHPSARCSLSDAVEAALLKAKLEKEGGQSASKNKKKKKQKHVPLMSLGTVYTPR